MFFRISLLISAIFLSVTSTVAQDRSADHAAIIELRERALKALNDKNYSAAAYDLHPDFSFISVDSRRLRSAEAFQAYWEELHETVIEGIDLELSVDELTEFLGQDAGFATGTAVGTFRFKHIEDRTMEMRWSAILQKVSDRWTLRHVHFSSNLLDNPVLDAAKKGGTLFWSIVPATAALLVGLLGGWFLFRRRRA